MLGFVKERGNLSLRCQGRSANTQKYECQSTDAQHRGRVTRSREEGAVMALDRRGDVVGLSPVCNLKWKDEQ